MREIWARRIALLTGLLVLLLAVLFALDQNPIAPVDTPADTTVDSHNTTKQIPATEILKSIDFDLLIIEAGQTVYQQQSCARCHSIEGKGNLRNPLDGVGRKHTAEEMADWITGAESLQAQFSSRVLRLKQMHNELSKDQLDALIIYMLSLRT